jgi:branched-chain amino acid transport system substrate-binding protein
MHRIHRRLLSPAAQLAHGARNRFRRPRVLRGLAVGLAAVLIVAGSAIILAPRATSTPLRIGAVFPISGTAAGLAREEERGVQTAVDFVNADGGIAGRSVVLDVRDLESASDAAATMASLKADGVSVVIGAYSSDLSIAASSAANTAGLVYWEAGAVADQLTGRGLPLVFRVGTSGANLGTNSATFAAQALAPRLGVSAQALRIAVVSAQDTYAQSVADAATTAARAAGMPIVADLSYSLSLPRWPALMTRLAAAKPDVIILASHIPDGVAFRQATLTAGLHVQALIGSTMAECSPDFAGALGADAIGVFASDRPTGGFQPSALSPAAKALYDRLAAAWVAGESPAPTTSHGYDAGGWGGYGASAAPSGGYAISGPVEEGSAAAGPSEEGLSGFTAAWALLHDVLSAAAEHGNLNPEGIAATARAIDLPVGSLPNGAGLRFSSATGTLGQNVRAAAVIWQWQAVRSYTFVWPATYATGAIRFVPLPR